MEEYKANEMASSDPSISTPQGHFPQFGTSAQNLPLISPEIQKQINAAKSNGWGAQLRNALFSNKKGAVIAMVAILLFVLGSTMSKSNEQSPESTQKNERALLGQSGVLPIELNVEGNVVIAEEGMSITKTANQGEGITHLARYALREYLVENAVLLSNEQKIYAEDYVQNKTGEELLRVGESLSFQKNLLDEAVQRAQALEQWQIENLKQYSATVSLL